MVYWIRLVGGDNRFDHVLYRGVEMTYSTTFKSPLIGFILHRGGIILYLFSLSISIGCTPPCTKLVCVNKSKLLSYLREIYMREANGMVGVGSAANYSPNVVIEIMDAVESGFADYVEEE